MDFYIVNGGPRKKYNTVQLLEKASEGIFDELENNQIEDINIHQIRLYDLDFKGCKSCFHCKRIGGKYYAQCPIKDDLRELLPEIKNSDGIVFGSPIYFGEITGELRSFMERFLFGTNKSSETRKNTLRPEQVGQAPKGLLNENIRGSSSPKEMPCSSQA